MFILLLSHILKLGFTFALDEVKTLGALMTLGVILNT